MTRLHRSIAVAIAVAALSLAAGSASALSSVNLVWKSTGTDTISPAASSTITALIVLQGDSLGVAGVFVSILFDTAELDVISVLEHSGPAAFPAGGSQFAPLGPGVGVDEAGGVITQFESAITPGELACISCTITLGSVVFHAVAPLENDGLVDDVRLAVLPNGFDAIVAGDFSLVSANFGNAEVVPEPTTGLLVVMGGLALGFAGRRGLDS